MTPEKYESMIARAYDQDVHAATLLVRDWSASRAVCQMYTEAFKYTDRVHPDDESFRLLRIDDY